MQPVHVAFLTAVASAAVVVQPTGVGAQIFEPYISEGPLDHLADAAQYAEQIAGDKLAASQELADARSAFYDQLDQGILGSPQERAFAELLRAKDLYFLSLNASEGVVSSTRRNGAINTLTGILTGSTDLTRPAKPNPYDLVGGEPLADDDMDGGITAKSAFTGWVDEVRRHLGATADGQMIFIGDPGTYQAAIVASTVSYDAYRAERDKAEFQRWRDQRPRITVPPLADPEARVDTYLTFVKGVLDERGVPDAEINEWLPRMKATLLRDENAEVTAEIIPEFLKAKGFSPQDVVYWQRTYDQFRTQPDYSPIWTPLDALCETQVMRDRRDSGSQDPSCRDEGWLVDIKRWLAGDVQAQEHELMVEVHVTDVVNYATASLVMKDGRFQYEPPLPAFHQWSDAPEPTPEPAVTREAAPAPAPTEPPAPRAPVAIRPTPPPRAADIDKILAGERLIAWGVLPGDELDAADATIRQQMQVAAVVDNDPAAWGYSKGVVTARVYVAEDDASRLTLMWLPDDPKRRIVAIARRLAMQGGPISPDQVTAMLTGQFGPVSDGTGPGETWHSWVASPADPPPQCARIMAIGLGNGFTVSSGTLPEPIASEGWQSDATSFAGDNYMSSDFQYPDRVAGLASCPAVVWSYYGFGMPHPFLSTGVADAALASGIAGGANPAPTPDLKAMLHGTASGDSSAQKHR